jgi:phosphotransferase system HPr (HPr) family protein
VIQDDLTLTNQLGLHARAAAKIVKLVLSFQSEVWFSLAGGDRQVDARSIISLVGMGVGCGASIRCCISGPDETEALIALQQLFLSKFGES